MEGDQTNLTYDLGILTLYDSNPLNFKCDFTDASFTQKLQQHSFENIKRIVHSLYSLKTKQDQVLEAIPDEHQVIDFSQSQYIVKLPAATTVFPRHKKIPEKQAQTRWEKFAQDKGIQKQRRSRMVYDEITRSYVPRWGPGSIKKIQNSTDIIRNVKPGEDPNEDPFEKKSKKKSLDNEKQKFRELRNKMEAKGISTREELPGTISQSQRGRRDKKATSKALQIAQRSTASMGMFDKKAHKEEPAIVKKRKNTGTHFGDAKAENRRDLDILDQVTRNQGSQRVSK